MVESKREQRQREQRPRLVIRRRDTTRETPRPQGAEPPAAPLYTEPSFFEGMASAFDPFPTMDDSPSLYLSGDQQDTISRLSDLLALAGDRVRVDTRARARLLLTLKTLSRERRALPQSGATRDGRVTIPLATRER